MSGKIDSQNVETLPVEVVSNQAVAIRTANALDVSTEDFQSALDRRKANRAALMTWVRSALKEKQDYHVIKNKKSLSKAGSEKVLGMLGLTPTFPAMDQYVNRAQSGTLQDQIVMKCMVLNADGDVVAHGIGARSLSSDNGDLNKTLKMATKSAQIDATLRCAGLSEIFTQDLEDMPRKDIGDKPSSGPSSDLPEGVEREMQSTKENGYCWFCDRKRHIQKGEMIVLAKISGKDDPVWGSKECYIKNILKSREDSAPEVSPETFPSAGDHKDELADKIQQMESMRFGDASNMKVAASIESERKKRMGTANLNDASEVGLGNYLEWLNED